MKTIKLKFLLAVIFAAMAMTNCSFAQTVTGSGTYLYLPKFTTNPTGSTIGNSQIQDNGTNVGIGISPSYKLDVDGHINLNVSAIVNNLTNAYKIAGNNVLVLAYNGGVFSTVFVGVGAGAGGTAPGPANTFVGYNAGYYSSNSSVSENTFIGSEAGKNNGFSVINDEGTENTFIGSQAGKNNNAGEDNDFEGQCAGRENLDGNYNTFIGHWAGTFNQHTHQNTALGAYALGTHGNGTSLTGNSNNVAIGYYSLLNSNGGQNLTAIGTYSGITNVNGNNNSFLGYGADVASSNLSNVTAIGNSAIVATDNTMILGNNEVSVGIGISGFSTGPYAKLHVERDLSSMLVSQPIAAYIGSSDIDVAGTYAGTNTGLYAEAYGQNNYNDGISSFAFQANSNYAGSFFAVQEARDLNTGGYFIAERAPVNFAVYGTAPNFDPDIETFNVGIYGEAPQTSIPDPNNVTPNSGSWAGYFNGDVVSMSYNFIPSDSTIKTNIKKFNNASAILNQINCYTYHYDSTKYGNHVNLPKNKQYGFLAQQVAKVIPEFVIDGGLPPQLDSIGHIITQPQPIKMIDYVRFVPLLQEGFKEQQVIIDSLNNRLTLLETLVASCCSQSQRNANPETTGENDQQKIKLENSTACIL